MAIAVIENLPPIAPPIPFCEKQFKFVRVVADAHGRSCVALFYKIVALCCSLFSAKVAHHYRSLANYQSFRGGNQWTAYRHFGKEIIDFSVNTSTRVKELLSGEETEGDKLKSTYGKEAIERWSQIGTADFPLQSEQLSRKEMGDGYCFGITCDFISQYLQKIRSGIAPFEAVKSVSGRYTEGAPDEAQLGQIFYQALNLNHKQLYDVFHIRADMTLAQANQQMQDFEVAIEKSREKQERMIARNFGLELEARHTLAFKKGKFNENGAEFDQFVKGLPEGIYAALFGTHAVTFIKTADGPCFIQDPNFCTLAVDSAQSGERLWNIARNYMNDNHGTLTFSSYRLTM